MAVVYGGLVLGCVFLPPGLLPVRPLFDIGVVFAPVLIHRWITRRFEFEADQVGVELTRNPQMTIQALENLYQFTGVPARSGWLTELFATHPSLVRRTRAIQRRAAARKSVVVS
jgi:Zn-dependent protease with chaperone function